VLDRAAIVLGERFEERLADGTPGRTVVDIRSSIPPRRGDGRRENAIARFGKRRELVASVAFERRPARLENEQVRNTSVDGHEPAGSDYPCGAGVWAGPDERLPVLVCANRNASPEMVGHVHGHALEPGIPLEEVIAEHEPEGFRLPHSVPAATA
jgi:hypothetical protein